MSEQWFEFNLQEKDFFPKMMFLWLPPVILSFALAFIFGLFTGSSAINLFLILFLAIGVTSLFFLFFLFIKTGGYILSVFRVSLNPNLISVERVFRDKKSRIYFVDYKPPIQNPNPSINFEKDKIMTNQWFNDRSMVKDLSFGTDKIYLVEGASENIDLLKENPVDPKQKDICALIKVCFDAGVDAANYFENRTNLLLIIIGVALGLLLLVNLIMTFISSGNISQTLDVVTAIQNRMPLDVNTIVSQIKTNMVYVK